MAVWSGMRKEGYIVMRLRTVKYFFKESFTSLVRNSWMSLASIGAVASALIILGSFLLLSVNFDYILKDVESQVEITAYLEDTLDQDNLSRLKEDITSTDGVKEAQFISRKKPSRNLKNRLGKNCWRVLITHFPILFGLK